MDMVIIGRTPFIQMIYFVRSFLKESLINGKDFNQYQDFKVEPIWFVQKMFEDEYIAFSPAFLYGGILASPLLSSLDNGNDRFDSKVPLWSLDAQSHFIVMGVSVA